MTLEACPEAIFIPAHIWTPHFSLLGAFSGFDSIEACFGDLAGQIHALETGLSSDPPMNWRVSNLDGRTLVSNSDAHSPAKLAREANLLSVEADYPALKRAIETGEGLRAPSSFFPRKANTTWTATAPAASALNPPNPAVGRALSGLRPQIDRRRQASRRVAFRPPGRVRTAAKRKALRKPDAASGSAGLLHGRIGGLQEGRGEIFSSSFRAWQ